jgi:hypothetical protein
MTRVMILIMTHVMTHIMTLVMTHVMMRVMTRVMMQCYDARHDACHDTRHMMQKKKTLSLCRAARRRVVSNCDGHRLSRDTTINDIGKIVRTINVIVR